MNHRPYPAYKDSGIEWLGEIPEHWEIKPLFTVFNENKRKNLNNIESNLLSLSYGRIIRKDIEDNYGLLPDSFDTYQVVEKGNIILRLTDLQNDKRSLRVGYVNERGIITAAYVGLVSYRCDSNPAFFARLLYNFDIAKVFYSYGGGVRQSMKYQDLKYLPLISPPLPEQRAIAAFLDRETARIDGLIEKKQRQIELLQEKRAALISHAVTKGLNPNAKMKDSGIEWLGEIPEHWEVTKLSLVTERIGDGLHGTPEYLDNSGLYFINGNNLVNEKIDYFENTREVTPEEYKANKLPLGDNTVLLSINGTIGNIGIYHGEEIMLGKSAAYINCGPRLNRLFLSKYLQSYPLRRYIDLVLTGTTISNLSLASIRNMPIVLPPKSEQENIYMKIEGDTKKLDCLTKKVVESMTLLREYRTALISAAVTGKIDVRVDKE